MEDLKLPSKFRMFVNNMYYAYLDENNFTSKDKTVKEYFNKNKWFLKKLYKEEK